MLCATCRHSNEADSRFCARCGASLERVCAACGSSLSLTARFCRHCGAALEPVSPSQSQPVVTGEPAVGERRQLTVMFCDLVGFTDLGQRLDPEDLRDILTEYQDCCSEAIAPFEGHIAQYLGDGLLIYFGFPRAHDDDAYRAVRAGLAIQSSLAELKRRRLATGGHEVSARLAIHTGRVLVTQLGDGSRQETLALGDTPNLTARMLGLADPGGVLISHTTLRLVSNLFLTRDLGTPELKGVSRPIRVHEVVGRAQEGTHFAASSTLTPLTGREQELGHFLDRWEQVQEGRGQLLMVSGEPGIGKTRLLHAFRERLADTPHFALELSCSPYTAGSAFQPVLELFERILGFTEELSPEEKLARLEERLAQLPGLELKESVPYLVALLALPPSTRYPLEHMASDTQREKTLDALLAPLLELATRRPLLVACEDLHWSDPSTLEVLGRLIDQAPTLPMLIVLTFRPSFEPPWQIGRSYVSPLVLSRLTRRNTRIVIEAAAGPESKLPNSVLDQIVERADGVPLYAEELTRSVVDSELASQSDRRSESRARIAAPTVPTTLQDSLMARLDRLSAAKPVAQLGAALGREFSYSLIEAVADFEVGALRSGLEQLIDAEILYRRGVPPKTSYVFKHALLRDTAYESLLKSRRRTFHARTAEILEERFPQRVAAEPELMARHCSEGGLISRAVTYYRRAGEQAIARLSNAEALDYFNLALELLATLPVDDERNSREIELRVALGGPLSALRGYDDPEAIDSCERIEALCSAVGEGPQQLPGLLGLTLYSLNQGHMPRARAYAEALLRIADPLGVAPLRVAGHMIRGTASITTATMAEARRDLEIAIDIANTAELPPPTEGFQVDLRTVAYGVYALALLVSGKPDSALVASEQGLQRGRELAHTRTLASALVNSSMAFHILEDPESTRRLTQECLNIVTGRGFHSVECSARVQNGWARASLGDSEGIHSIEEALERASAAGSLGGLCQLHFTATETYMLAGQFDRAFEALARGATLIERTGEWVAFGPQVKTTRAKLLLESGTGTPEEAERLLLESIEQWRQNHSLWLELRSAILLGRLAQQTGKTGPARTQLEKTYARFTEGFETQRLREARSLIEALA